MIDLETWWLKWSLSVPHSAQQLFATCNLTLSKIHQIKGRQKSNTKHVSNAIPVC